eukprot:TRINITY_DN38084_c0_g1_i1.p1 TRINITY_DN38084_c0_g1~~TRINITY_DN38084_c0_g1_i1.p1  ORF type:complete len:196 (-),score=34.84 TRINITY_DN38084_c0_g1_i1:47-634(-)
MISSAPTFAILTLVALAMIEATSPDCDDPDKLLWSSACQAPCSLCVVDCVTSCQDAGRTPCLPSCPATACHPDMGTKCQVDGFVGSYLMHEDTNQRVWNFTLEPGQMTSMHQHDFDYTFVVVRPSHLEVFGEDGSRLFDFWAEGTKAFRVQGDLLEPISGSLPWPVPRIHSARNIGTTTYNEILFESKVSSCPAA